MEPSNPKISKRGTVHLLLLGRSQDHVHRVIEHYHPLHVSFFTSASLLPEAQSLASMLEKDNITTRIITVEPFNENAVCSVQENIIQEYEHLIQSFPVSEADYYIGLTGGTNLMVLGAGKAAANLKIQSHYVLNPEFIDVEKSDLIIELTLSSLMKLGS